MADIASSDVSVTVAQEDVKYLGLAGRLVTGSISLGDGALTYDLSGGIPLPKANLAANQEIKELRVVKVDQGNDLAIRFDKDSQALRLYSGVKAEGMSTLTVVDDDCAASNGVALYANASAALPESGTGQLILTLEAVNAGNADSFFRLGQYGPTVKVEDNDCAASGNVALYLDENDNRIIADLGLPNDIDAFIQLSDGSLLRVYDQASPGCAGIQLYFDDDATNAHQRVLAVTAGNANDTVTQEFGNDEVVPPVNFEFVAIVD